MITDGVITSFLQRNSKGKENHMSTTASAQISYTLADAAQFLSRVVPRGDDEAQRLSSAILMLERLSKK